MARFCSRCDCVSANSLADGRWREDSKATSATIAATKNNEQKIRRHGDAVNVRWAFLIIELGMGLVDRAAELMSEHAFNQKRSASQDFQKVLIGEGTRPARACHGTSPSDGGLSDARYTRVIGIVSSATRAIR